MNIFIRDEREEDIKEIEELTKAAFRGGSGNLNNTYK
jgi:predicted N-acetyltransferase YhbS